MPKLTFLPMNVTYEVNTGDSILDVAIQNDVSLQHACGGFCACTTCHVFVKSGEQNLSSIEDDELDRLDVVADRKSSSRLGCQAKVQGDVVVEVVEL